jgi:hypothetical protein
MAAYLIFWEPPAPVVSVSMSVVLRRAKKLRVNTAFGGCLTAVGIGTDLVDFLAVSEVPLEVCLLPLCTFWKSSSWAVDSNECLFTAALCLVCGCTWNHRYRFSERTQQKTPFPSS